ncbi:MAG: ABC transporter ATP-binding protein [Clostridiales bacterium]|nr:ABC transporter ATP-binding protein [Clostridiales bacterium]
MKITLQNLTKIFPGRKKGEKEVRAVDDMNIEIPSGKLVGLLGPSGCGKSTTLFMLSGLESPTSGKILFDEQDVTTLAAEKRGIGLVFQNYALYPHMTVEQNIRFPLDNMRIKKDEGNARALDAARLVQIEDLLQRKPNELSGGQQQRVAIARALVKMPNVLLLDEPLSNLDARLRLQTREEIKRIQRETGITTVFVTHDQEEAMSICDIMVVMKLGIVQQIGEPQGIYDDPNNLFVANFLGTPPINIFKGKVEGGKIYIGDEAILETDVADQEVYVGIRPEGFIYEPNNRIRTNVLTLNVDHVEVMGRDKSVVSTHESSTKPTVRCIIDSDVALPKDADKLRFKLKPNKVFLFNAETEERIR